MMRVLWQRFVAWFQRSNHAITGCYLCFMVTLIFILLLTASPVETCN